jgi:hypothetical protein
MEIFLLPQATFLRRLRTIRVPLADLPSPPPILVSNQRKHRRSPASDFYEPGNVQKGDASWRIFELAFRPAQVADKTISASCPGLIAGRVVMSPVMV